jgi:hypothetical protein
VVEPQREEIVEWNDAEQERHPRAFVAIEPFAGEHERQIKRETERDAGQQVVGPVGQRKEREPRRREPDQDRRMLGIAERPIAHQDHRLRHVGVQVVARFGDHRVKRPRQRIEHGDEGHGAVAAGGVGQRFREAVGGG